MLSTPRNQRVSADPTGNHWQLLSQSRAWAPVSRRVAPWVMTLTWLMQAIFPWFLAKGINAAFPTDGSGVNAGSLALWVGLMTAMAILAFPSLALRHHTTFQTRLSTQYWLLAGVQQKTIDGGAAKHDELPPGKVLTTAAADTMSMAQFSMMSVQVAGWITALVVAIGMTASVSLLLAGALTVGILLSALMTGPISKRFQARLAVQRKTLSALTDHASDGITGLRVLRGVGGQQQFLAEYDRRNDRDRDAAIAAETLLGAIMAVASLTPGVLTLILVTWGAVMVLEGSIAPGDIVMVAGATRFIFMPVTQLGTWPSQIGKARVATARLQEIFGVQTYTEPQGLLPGAVPVGRLHDPVTNLTFEPGVMTMVHADEPFEATKLARRLARLDPTAECASIDGVSLADWPIAQVREAIVLNDTHPLLLSGTLRSQLDPMGEHSDTWLRTVMHVAGADDVLELLPDGLDDYVSERGRSLSGGQRQRVALARVLARDPAVLILVEPTSAVDAFTESLVAQRLAAFRAGKTTIIAAASPLMADRADRVIHLEAERSHA